jgi:hypothetical protein
LYLVAAVLHLEIFIRRILISVYICGSTLYKHNGDY